MITKWIIVIKARQQAMSDYLYFISLAEYLRKRTELTLSSDNEAAQSIQHHPQPYKLIDAHH